MADHQHYNTSTLTSFSESHCASYPGSCRGHTGSPGLPPEAVPVQGRPAVEWSGEGPGGGPAVRVLIYGSGYVSPRPSPQGTVRRVGPLPDRCSAAAHWSQRPTPKGCDAESHWYVTLYGTECPREMTFLGTNGAWGWQL